MLQLVARDQEHVAVPPLRRRDRDTPAHKHTHTQTACSQPKFSISLPLLQGKLLRSYKAADCYFCSVVHGEQNINGRSECRIVLKTPDCSKVVWDKEEKEHLKGFLCLKNTQILLLKYAGSCID